MRTPGEKILIIDDSNTNVVLLQAVLSRNGYNTMTALSAKEAYSRIEDNKPDLILLDLLMPEISGFDFLEHIKSEEGTKNIPVIVVSAVTDTVNIKKAMDMGANDFIKKPIELQILLTKVKDVLAIFPPSGSK